MRLNRLHKKSNISLRPLLLMLALSLTVAFTLAGCAKDKMRIREAVEQNIKNTDQQLARIQNIANPRPALLVDERPWYGQRAIPFQNGDPLPKEMEQDDALVLTFDRPLSLNQVAARIQGATGIRIIVKTARQSAEDNTLSGGQATSGQTLFLPVDGEMVSGGRIVWQGSLSNILDQVADRFDARWAFNGKNIRLSQHVVRTFMLHSLAGSVEIQGSISAGDSESGSLPTQDVNTSAELEIWDDIESAINNIVGTDATATYSPASGTITVAGSPSAVDAVEQYLKIQNDLRLRRVAIEVQVLSVTLNEDFNFNFDLDVVFEKAFEDQPFVFSSIQGTGTRGVEAGLLRSIPSGLGDSDSVQAVVNALDALSEELTVDHSGSVITLSDQPAPLQVATKRSYIARVTGSSSEGGSSTTLEPGTIDIGLTMNVLPRVIERDRMILRVAIGITNLVELREVTTDDAQIQLPEIDTTGFLQNVVMKSGETLVLAGFERKTANDSNQGVGTPKNVFLGTRQDFSKGRDIRVLLIRGNILPTEPVEIVQR